MQPLVLETDAKDPDLYEQDPTDLDDGGWHHRGCFSASWEGSRMTLEHSRDIEGIRSLTRYRIYLQAKELLDPTTLQKDIIMISAVASFARPPVDHSHLGKEENIERRLWLNGQGLCQIVMEDHPWKEGRRLFTELTDEDHPEDWTKRFWHSKEEDVQAPDYSPEEVLALIRMRFEESGILQSLEGISWDTIEQKLRESPEKLRALVELENRGGKPGFYNRTGDNLIFGDLITGPIWSVHPSLTWEETVETANRIGAEVMPEEDFSHLMNIIRLDVEEEKLSWADMQLDVWAAQTASLGRNDGVFMKTIWSDRMVRHLPARYRVLVPLAPRNDSALEVHLPRAQEGPSRQEQFFKKWRRHGEKK